ncbi:MAG: DUF1653 domain-containing protein [Clostridiales bacterium]|nr:DUF1653 domain-containing protein [Clostridiales bacterium]
MIDIEIGALYRHFKGNTYRVIAVAKHTENMEDMIVYSPENDNSLVWVRPMSMWNEIVDKDTNKKRFEKVEN